MNHETILGQPNIEEVYTKSNQVYDMIVNRKNGNSDLSVLIENGYDITALVQVLLDILTSSTHNLKHIGTLLEHECTDHELLDNQYTFHTFTEMVSTIAKNIVNQHVTSGVLQSKIVILRGILLKLNDIIINGLDAFDTVLTHLSSIFQELFIRRINLSDDSRKCSIVKDYLLSELSHEDRNRLNEVGVYDRTDGLVLIIPSDKDSVLLDIIDYKFGTFTHGVETGVIIVHDYELNTCISEVERLCNITLSEYVKTAVKDHQMNVWENTLGSNYFRYRKVNIHSNNNIYTER